MENQELNVNQPAQPVQAVKENREDKKSKKGLFVILFLLLLIILFAVYYFFLRQPKTTSETNTTKNTTNTATENTIVCDVDNQKSVTFKMTNVNSMKSGTNTIIALMANKANEDYSKVYTLQVLIPGTTTMDYTQKPTDYNVGLHYGSSAEDSYQTNMDNGDTFHIKITKFEGNHIVGQFSGELTRITSNGWDTTKKVNLKNCVIDSTKEIKPL